MAPSVILFFFFSFFFPRWGSPAGNRLEIFSAATVPVGTMEGYILEAKGGPPTARDLSVGNRTMAHPSFPPFVRVPNPLLYIPGGNATGPLRPSVCPVEGRRIDAQVTRHGAFSSRGNRTDSAQTPLLGEVCPKREAGGSASGFPEARKKRWCWIWVRMIGR